jgi:hypothetical protein
MTSHHHTPPTAPPHPGTKGQEVGGPTGSSTQPTTPNTPHPRPGETGGGRGRVGPFRGPCRGDYALIPSTWAGDESTLAPTGYKIGPTPLSPGPSSPGPPPLGLWGGFWVGCDVWRVWRRWEPVVSLTFWRSPRVRLGGLPLRSRPSGGVAGVVGRPSPPPAVLLALRLRVWAAWVAWRRVGC